ncbi:DUF1937 family protein [Mesorhizobium sp. M0659]|uniref:DUF1937 family protein n=1 Tax=Mesorhizobium sp. M0659 TaxID=2956980 RepID=UPI00333C4566
MLPKKGEDLVSETDKGIVYLACPYTDPDRQVRELRFRSATEAAAALISQGRIVFSPITMTHPIDVVLSKEAGTLGSDFWVSFDEAFMNACSEIVLLQIGGWRESKGIAREIDHFYRRQKPISIMTETHIQKPLLPMELRQLLREVRQLV